MAKREFTYRPNGNPQFLQDHLQKFGTTATTEEQVGPSIKIPGGMLGKNGSLAIYLKALATNDAVVKNLRVRIGNTADVLSGTVIANLVLTSLAGGTAVVTFANRDSQAVNLSSVNGTGVTTAVTPQTVDTAKDVYIVFSTQKASGAAASISLESYLVELKAEPAGASFQ